MSNPPRKKIFLGLPGEYLGGNPLDVPSSADDSDEEKIRAAFGTTKKKKSRARAKAKKVTSETAASPSTIQIQEEEEEEEDDEDDHSDMDDDERSAWEARRFKKLFEEEQKKKKQEGGIPPSPTTTIPRSQRALLVLQTNVPSSPNEFVLWKPPKAGHVRAPGYDRLYTLSTQLSAGMRSPHLSGDMFFAAMWTSAARPPWPTTVTTPQNQRPALALSLLMAYIQKHFVVDPGALVIVHSGIRMALLCDYLMEGLHICLAVILQPENAQAKAMATGTAGTHMAPPPPVQDGTNLVESQWRFVGLTLADTSLLPTIPGTMQASVH